MPETLGPTVLITAFTLVSLSTVVVAIRFYCRYFLLRSVKLHDYLMLLALILTWGIATINYYQVKFGTGVHTEDQDPSLGLLGLEGTLKSWYTYQLVYLATLCAVKFSILIFYRGISSQRGFRITIYTLMGVVGVFTVAMIFVNAFECPNPSDAWSTEILFQGKGSCHDLHPIYYSQAGFNILSDVALLLLPMPVLYNLQMRRNKRIALIAIFSAGSIAVVASAVRVYALTIWSAPGADVPYAGANILIWSQIEINAAIISASIPSLKPLFKLVFGFTAPSRSRPSNYYSPSFGNTNVAGAKTFSSHGAALSSSAISFSRGRDYMSPHMELEAFGNSSGRENEEGFKYSRSSDEEIILSNTEKYPSPQNHNPHDYFPTALPPTTRATAGQYNTSDHGRADTPPGLHIMRSVTIETSVNNDAGRNDRTRANLNVDGIAADPFHPPRRQRSPGPHDAYQSY